MKWSDLAPTEDWTWQFRAKLVFAAWALAAVASAAFSGALLVFAFPVFPLGLYYGIPGLSSLLPSTHTPPSETTNYLGDYFLAVTAGWLLYSVVCLAATMIGKRKPFLLFYLILILLLILNVQGCHTFVKHGE
jgi:hypothetical protein